MSIRKISGVYSRKMRTLVSPTAVFHSFTADMEKTRYFTVVDCRGGSFFMKVAVEETPDLMDRLRKNT